MKIFRNIILHLSAVAALVFAASCEDLAMGDNFLRKPPSNDVTIDTVFSTKEYAVRVLWRSYRQLPYGHCSGWNNWTGMWVGNLENLTDLSQSYVGYGGPESIYYSGLYNSGIEDKNGAAGATKYRFRDRAAWKGIRLAWLFYENVDRVPDMDAAEKARLKAEAKILVALQYIEMIRNYGSVPILDHAISPTDVNLPKRATLQENVDFVVSLLNNAIAAPELPWVLPEDEVTNWSGRLTKASAMGLKARFLLFVASPLFNSDNPYFEGAASSQKMTWFGDFKQERWEMALKACEDFFNELKSRGGYELDKDASEPRLGFRKAYFTPGAKEILVSSRRYRRSTDNSFFMQSARWGGFCPTKEYFDMFPMKDGSAFDWNDPAKAANPFVNRDPRLSETILLDGDIFGSGTADVVKAKPGDKANYPAGQHWGLKGVLDSKSLSSGIAGRKFVLDRQGEYKQQPLHWPILRLAEIYLSYAEALNECGRTVEAYDYVNSVRARVGVGPLSAGLDKVAFREAVLKERACEFGWEEVRFFDMIRWKREDDFKKPLHNMFVYRHKITSEYKFDFTPMKKRAWQGDGFSAKWYLSAFPLSEVNKGYGLVQNPGWE